jgi:putative sigma-54 modulation protein
MIVEYTGRQTTVTAKLKSQAEIGLARIEKVANRPTSAHVILTEEKYRKIAEVNVKATGEDLVATCMADVMETALRDALLKAEKQAVKHKTKWETVTHRAGKQVAAQDA